MIILLAILLGILYRMGGSKDYNTLWRDLGVSLAVTLALWLTHGFTWWLIPSMGLFYGALTTYNDWIKIPWLQWAVTGASYGVAYLPYGVSIHHIQGCLLRTLVLAGAIAWLRLWNKPIWKWSSDIVVEFGNGMIIGITLLLF